MAYAVDIQSFMQPGGDIVVKELAIMPLDYELNPIVLLFKAPFSWSRLNEKYRRENTRLKRSVHGLEWDSGDIDYTKLGSLLHDSLPDVTTIYVIGNKNKEFIERFKYFTIDIMELGYPQVDKAKVVQFCPNHDFNCRISCAAQNVKLIKKFLNAQKEWETISMEWEYA